MMKRIQLGFLVVCMVVFSAQLCFAAAANDKLPNIKILATGGTIAGSAPSSTEMTGYEAGAIGIQTLIDAVP